MSLPVDCCSPCCSTAVPVNVIGSPGINGSNGAAGVSAYSVTSTTVTVPAVNSDVTVTGLTSTLWMVVGQIVVIGQGQTALGVPGPATFRVKSITNSTEAVLTKLGAAGDVAPGTVISIGAYVSPSGLPGPASTPLISSGSGIAQAVTAVASAIAGVSVTLASSAKNHLFLAKVSFSTVGATFAASRTVTIRLRNTTQGTTLATRTFATQKLTTQDLPDFDITTPYVQSSAGVAADSIGLDVAIDVINSAGTFQVTAASLLAIPLA